MIDSNGIPQPSKINSKEYRDNYDLIFCSVFCCNCGILINKKNLEEKPELYIKHLDGEIEHKNCNFN